MLRNEPVDSHLHHDVLAFEYVTGVMRGEERSVFEQVIRSNEKIADQVRFWEEQLIQLCDEQQERIPDPDVWRQIHAALSTEPPAIHHQKKNLFEFGWFRWAMLNVIFIIFACTLLFFNMHKTIGGPNVDYVAVLTSPSGEASLTVLTAPKGAALWLKWDKLTIASNKNVQLWAISKRDKQIRPLGVFAQTDVESMQLSNANWRLIKDAESLILTEEDIGGSAIDEPSDTILAKGVCVLLAKIEKSI
jgi:anti-sigma-K factor RskA